MKNTPVFLFILYVVSYSSFCYAQKLVANENGLIVTYKVVEKIGSRYDDYCKTTFDIYTVEGTVENLNTDKAAMATTILSFKGQHCNKIYSNDAPIKGEVADKMFNLDIFAMSGQQSKRWSNRFVHLLPNDKMTGKGHVEVIQGGQVLKPEIYFNYELILSQEGKPMQGFGNQGASAVMGKKIDDANLLSQFNTLILGKWTLIDLKVSNVNSDKYPVDTRYYRIFKPNGELEFWAKGKKETTYNWSIKGNVLIMQSDEYRTTNTTEILSLENSKLVIKSAMPEKKWWSIETLKKIK